MVTGWGVGTWRKSSCWVRGVEALFFLLSISYRVYIYICICIYTHNPFPLIWHHGLVGDSYIFGPISGVFHFREIIDLRLDTESSFNWHGRMAWLMKHQVFAHVVLLCSRCINNPPQTLKTYKKSLAHFFSPIYSQMNCLSENEYISGLFLSTYIFPNELPFWKRIYKWTFPFHL